MTTAAAVLGLAIVAAPAWAQAPANNANSSSSSSSASASSATTQLPADQWRASKMVGLNVYNDQNEKIGDINEVMLDKSGKVHSVIIGVGGFLGMGEHDVAMEFDKLKFVDEPVRSSSSADTRSTTTTGSSTGASSSAGTRSTTSDTPRHYPDHAVVNASKDQLKSMPQVKY